MFIPFHPAPYWRGPYSPRRGYSNGLTIRGQELVLWGESDHGKFAWTADKSVDDIFELVVNVYSAFGGGHIKIYPSGHVIKPLRDEETGKRQCPCQARGISQSLRFFDDNRNELSQSTLAQYESGSQIPFPNFGLEAVLKPDGSLVNQTEHTASYGRERQSFQLSGPNEALARGFRSARGGGESGRVRISPFGSVTTVREESGVWKTFLVGWLNEIAFDDNWLEQPATEPPEKDSFFGGITDEIEF